VKNIWKSFWVAVTAVVIVGSTWAVLNPQTVIDWWRLRDYEPPVAVARLATDASFNDEGKKLFYVHYPEVLNKQNFQGKCSLTEETIVLGCYISNDKIYVFDVEDDRLEGVEQVTAAHEMLHAAYDRLSDSEKENVDKLLLDYYEELNDPRLNKTIQSYRERDPSVVPNELHSILATEYSDLPEELEDYYSQYFLDRSAVVAYSNSYEAEFTKLEDQIEAYEIQLRQLEGSINNLENQLVQLGSALEFEKNQLAGLTSDPQSYNIAVEQFNIKVRDYNEQLRILRIDIENYNEIVRKRNEIAVQEQELIDSIDTRNLEL
jgi:hypothetical protein